MKTKEISIVRDGKEDKVTIKRMGWAEKNRFVDQFLEATILKNETIKLISHTNLMKVEALKICIIKAPFESNETGLNEEEPEMLDKIYEEVEKFNNLGKDQKELKKKLDELSGKPKKEE